jgi:hypothetical protein
MPVSVCSDTLEGKILRERERERERGLEFFLTLRKEGFFINEQHGLCELKRNKKPL